MPPLGFVRLKAQALASSYTGTLALLAVARRPKSAAALRCAGARERRIVAVTIVGRCSGSR